MWSVQSLVTDTAVMLPARPTLGELEAMMVRAVRFYVLRGGESEAEREEWCAKGREWAKEVDAQFDKWLPDTHAGDAW